MPANWNTIIRQILLRGNFFAGDQGTLALDYTTGHFTDASISKAGGEYSFAAIVDSILQAHSLIVGAIGMNRNSEYRRWFQDVTATIAHGALIPMLGTGTRERYGVVSDFKDAVLNRYLTFQPREMIEIAKKTLPRRKIALYNYYTDGQRVWHTRTNVIAEIVSWDRAAERVLILADNLNAVCPMPDSLLAHLEDGSLAFIFRDTFNAESAVMHWNKFAPELDKIAGKQMATAEMLAKL